MSTVPYFQSKIIADKTWMISYAFSAPEASNLMCYLLEGDEYALLIDTMMGWGDLKGYCESLTSLPIKVVNTHFHLDHTGGNFQFEDCYLHPLDIEMFFIGLGKTQAQVMESALGASLDVYKDQIRLEDFVDEKPIKVYPIDDGDIFDMGNRIVRVVHVGGHSAGSIALIDDKTRFCFTGDCCNGNTLLQLGNALPVASYMKSLLHFKKFQNDFDICYGGHQILEPSIIDEAIELVAKVIARTDDCTPYPGMRGKMAIYAAKRKENSFQRADGKQFNLCYNPDRINEEAPAPRRITNAPKSVF